MLCILIGCEHLLEGRTAAMHYAHVHATAVHIKYSRLQGHALGKAYASSVKSMQTVVG